MNNNDLDAYKQLGKSLKELHSSQLSTQLQVFQSALINFANDHPQEISSNLEFKNKFTTICQSVGLDPLDLLLYTNNNNNNNINNGDDFHVGLSVKIVEVCKQTRDLNGGLISIKELISILESQVVHGMIKLKITEKDVEKALTNLNVLGKGYDIVMINGKKWLKYSSTDNLSTDQLKIYELCEFMGGFVTYRLLKDNYGWDGTRCKTVIDEMIMNGFLWVDSQGEREWQFWEPSWISN
ncbi:SNF8 Vacuolar-sorting protein SNF8 [Candida maltosa Xu316]